VSDTVGLETGRAFYR